MSNEDIPGLSDIDLVNAKYAHRAPGYLLAAKAKQDPGNHLLQQKLSDHASRAQAIETQIAFRQARNNPSGPSTTL